MSGSKRGRSLAEVMSLIEDDESAHSTASAALGAGPQSMPSNVPGTPTGGDASVQAVVPINVLVAPEDRRRLRQLSLDSNLSLQKLGHEAWNLLLQKRGLPPLRPVTANVPSGRLSSRPRQ